MEDKLDMECKIEEAIASDEAQSQLTQLMEISPLPPPAQQHPFPGGLLAMRLSRLTVGVGLARHHC
jgi:hypothetical protein